jgi:hypothetical protein
MKKERKLHIKENEQIDKIILVDQAVYEKILIYLEMTWFLSSHRLNHYY